MSTESFPGTLQKAVMKINMPYHMFAQHLKKRIADLVKERRDLGGRPSIFDENVETILCLIGFYHNHALSEDEELSLGALTNTFVRCVEEGPWSGWSILHLMVERWKKLPSSECPLYQDSFFGYMVRCGADANVRFPNGFTILHRIVESSKHLGERRSLLTVLLDHGVHPDYRDYNGCTPMDLAATVEEISTLRKYSSLKCLAVNTIISMGIRVGSDTPTQLKTFIDDHRRIAKTLR